MHTLLTKLLLVLGLCSIIFSNKAHCNKIDSLKSLIERSEDEIVKTKLFVELSISYLGKDNTEALNISEKALELSKLNAYQYGIIKAYQIKGYVYLSLGNYTKALKNYFLAIRHLKSTNNDKSLAETYVNVGLIYNILGNAKESIKYSHRLLKLKSIQDSDILTYYYLNMADSYNLLKDYESELNYLRKGVQVRIKYNQIDKLGIEYNKLGSAFLNNKQYDSAIVCYNNYLTISSKINDSIGIARAYHNMGSVSYAIGEYKKSIAFFNKAEELNQANICLTHIEMVYSYCKLNNISKATFYFELARKQNDYLKELGIACDMLVSSCESRGNLRRTIYFSKLSTEIQKQINRLSKTDLELKIKPSLEAEGMEAKIAEKENHILLKEILALQKTNNFYLIIVVVSLFIAFLSVCLLLRKKQLEQKKDLSNISKVGVYLNLLREGMQRTKERAERAKRGLD